MQLIPTLTSLRNAIRRRLAAEHGYTIFVVLGVMVITSALVAATYAAVQGDTHITQRDLDSKRAFYAARAGLNAYLYQLNQDTAYWQTCSNDTQSRTNVPGSTVEQYSYAPIPANGNSSCTSDPIASLIDKSTGTLRMEFTGYAGPPNSSGAPSAQRGIVASFRKDSPLDFFWFTVYESLDSTISGYSDCGVFYRDGRPSHCDIQWVTGDNVNGPMYTDDQYLVQSGQSPVFGRDSNDKIESAATNSICTSNPCPGSLTLNGTAVTNAPSVSPPSDNSQLATDAQNYGKTYSGTTTIALSGTNATVTNCPGTTSGNQQCATGSVDLTQFPIIYVSNATGCTSSSYTPYSVTYQGYGCSGNVYVSGNYTTPVTIAAANDIIIAGSITTTHDSSGDPTGSGMAGLVANHFIRVEHGVTTRSGSSQGQCGFASNVSGQTLTNPTIDASILALQHSFIVDNYDCGAALGNLTVNGAIVQYFRGTVGTSGGSGAATGYLKQYNYDDRLSVTLPPYLFDIANSGWHVSRETLCVVGGSDPNTAC